MKKQMLFALLALTASQVLAYKVTGEEAKDVAPALCYLVPQRLPLQKHTEVGLPYDVPGLQRLDAPEALSRLELRLLVDKLDALIEKLDSLPEPK